MLISDIRVDAETLLPHLDAKSPQQWSWCGQWSSACTASWSPLLRLLTVVLLIVASGPFSLLIRLFFHHSLPLHLSFHLCFHLLHRHGQRYSLSCHPFITLLFLWEVMETECSWAEALAQQYLAAKAGWLSVVDKCNILILQGTETISGFPNIVGRVWRWPLPVPTLLRTSSQR